MAKTPLQKLPDKPPPRQKPITKTPPIKKTRQNPPPPRQNPLTKTPRQNPPTKTSLTKNRDKPSPSKTPLTKKTTIAPPDKTPGNPPPPEQNAPQNPSQTKPPTKSPRTNLPTPPQKKYKKKQSNNTNPTEKTVCDVIRYYHGAIMLVKCLQIYAFHCLKYFEFLFLDFCPIGSNNLFRSSIYNSACRIYSYMWCGLVEIICYRMLTSLDFYYVILHVTVIYLFYNRLTSWTVQSKDKCNLMRVFFQ